MSASFVKIATLLAVAVAIVQVQALPQNHTHSVSSASAPSITALIQSPKSQDEVQPSRMSQKVLIAHVICMTLSLLVFAPLGAILARYGRTLFAWSFVHRLFQGVCGLLAIAGLALGIAYTNLSPTSKGLASSHASVGLGLFIILVIQFVLGYASHIFFNSQILKYRSINFVHAGLGVTIIGLSFYDVVLGSEEWSTSKPHLKVIKYSLLGYGLTLLSIYCLGFLLIPREIKLNRLQYNSEHKLLKYRLTSAPTSTQETHLNQLESYATKLSIPKPLEEICGPSSLFYHNTDLQKVVVAEGEEGRRSVFEDDDEDDDKSMKEIRSSFSSSRKGKKRNSKNNKEKNHKSFELVRRNGYESDRSLQSSGGSRKSRVGSERTVKKDTIQRPEMREYETRPQLGNTSEGNGMAFVDALEAEDDDSLEMEFSEIRWSGVAL